MKIIGWDTETHLIEPGNLTPRFVCLTAYGGEDTLEAFTRWLDGRDRGPSLWTRITGECWEVLVTRDLALDFFVWALGVADRTVAHNAAFDWGVMCNEFPEVLPIHAALMEQGKVADTRVREQLWAIATDNFKYDRRVGKAEPGFSLSHCVEARLGIKLGTKSRITDTGKVLGNPDAWRLRYSELDGVPADQWPEAAISYAVDDARWAYDVYQHQAQPLDLPAGTVVGSDGTLTNETEQTAAAWVLHLMACHGVYTDAPRVESFHKEVEALVASAERAGRKAGFVVINRCKTCEGTGVQGGRPCRQCEGADHDTMLATGAYGIRKNGKAIAPAAPKTKTRRSRLQALVTAAYNGDPPMTERPANASATWKPQVSTSADTLLGSGHPLLEEYAQGSFAIKLLQTYYPILLRGIEVPVTSYPQVLVRSGRTSWRNPNFQNPPQKGGFRECFIPREGKVFASIDYTALEMCTLAQACLTLFGFSRMAEAINQGRDLHCGFAGQVLRSRGMHLSDDDVERILGKGVHEGQPAEKDHPLYAECAKARQEAKAGNFGFPGGLGVAAFVKFAKGSGVNLTFNQAEDLRSAWFERWEEMRPYFDMISDACDTNPDGRFTVKQLGSNRLRGGCSYTSGANTWFQGLAADGAKAAMWALYKACYVDTDSPLYGVRMWAFIHDEFLFEGDEDTAHLWAPAAARIMVAEMKKYTPDVKVGAEPALMRRWLKGAEPVYTPDGKLTLWSLESR